MANSCGYLQLVSVDSHNYAVNLGGKAKKEIDMVKEQIIREIESLPIEFYSEIMGFVGYLKYRHLNNVPETMLLSEKSLAENWNTPEEDAAWADL